MPYIKSGDGRREALQKGEPALNAGELNYQMFYYIKHNVPYGKDDSFTRHKISLFVVKFLGATPNYQKYNDMTGALIRCYKELNRRLNIDLEDMFLEIMESYDEEINEYEATKIISNGDVE